MDDKDTLHWLAKLAAWTHDPAEKALILMRTAEGHERGTVAKLQRAVFGKAGLPEGLAPLVRRADHWASAADRPQFPQDQRYPAWAQVRFDRDPVLTHPLTGEDYALGRLELDPAQLEAVSFDHFERLIVRDANGTVDARRTALAFWRFGPGTPAPGLDKLWQLLPADTRVPDHSIWSHLDLSSALATSFVCDPEQTPALLAVSFGPVQDFIAQARSTSDLWAGSHLLSRIAWEGLKVICERLGPDAVLFPQLRGVALADLWLRDQAGVPAELFERCDWLERATDANPLFAAALPNKLVAVVPAAEAAAIAHAIEHRVRTWVRDAAGDMLRELLKAANIRGGRELPCWDQLERQLAGFPEVHWAAVSWSLATPDGKAVEPAPLRAALAPLLPAGDGGFLDGEVWALLSHELEIDGLRFYRPNPGTLYPVLYELLERVAAAAKSVRPFARIEEHGYRDSLGGEQEWLTHDLAHLDLTPRQRKERKGDDRTLWHRVAGRFGIRDGEHLGAFGMLKRLWPGTFARQVAEAIGVDVRRYVVSTHTMALAVSLERWLERAPSEARGSVGQAERLLELAAKVEDAEPAVLPARLAADLRDRFRPGDPLRTIAERLPSRLDALRELDDDGTAFAALQAQAASVLGERAETYYALLLMDGDRMGAWLSGGDETDGYRLRFRDSWHPQVVRGLAGRDRGDLGAYLEALRPVSPARHMGISAALNGFAIDLARHVVERLCKGKLLYAGGDDVMAMLPVDDLPAALALLRLAYSGEFARDAVQAAADWKLLLGEGWRDRSGSFLLGGGHAVLKGRLYRLMGARATASAGAVIAHHQAPLAMVLRELRAAEKRAKARGRNAFSFTLVKRAGGITRLDCPWTVEGALPLPFASTPMGLLMRLRDAFASPALSRRAAYLAQEWLASLPDAVLAPGPAHAAVTLAPEQHAAMLGAGLAFQIGRQGGDAALGAALAELACRLSAEPRGFIANFLNVAEFLAREGRARPAADHTEDRA